LSEAGVCTTTPVTIAGLQAGALFICAALHGFSGAAQVYVPLPVIDGEDARA
jgi:hypothetical protein